MNETAAATMTAAQAPAAHTLASAHGHHWACLTAAEVIGKTSAEISALSCARVEPGIGCLNDAPVFDEEGDVVHTTGSGRLTWEIWQDGSVTVAVYRPASVNPAEADEGGVKVVHVRLPAAPYADDAEAPSVGDWCYTTRHALPRHLDAAAEAVRVLTSINPNAEAALAWIEEQRAACMASARWELQAQLDAVRTDTPADLAQMIEDVARRLGRYDSETAQAVKDTLKKTVAPLVSNL